MEPGTPVTAHVFSIHETSFTPPSLSVAPGATVRLQLMPGIKAAHLLLPPCLCSDTDDPEFLLTEMNPEITRTVQNDFGEQSVICDLIITVRGTLYGSVVNGDDEFISGDIDIVSDLPNLTRRSNLTITGCPARQARSRGASGPPANSDGRAADHRPDRARASKERSALPRP